MLDNVCAVNMMSLEKLVKKFVNTFLEIISMICIKIEINLKYSCNKIVSLYPCSTSRNLFFANIIIFMYLTIFENNCGSLAVMGVILKGVGFGVPPFFWLSTLRLLKLQSRFRSGKSNIGLATL